MLKLSRLKKSLVACCAIVTCLPTLAKDANNPIDPAPTFGMWNRFYADDFSRLQLLGNVTYGKWFYRVTAEQQINYGESDQFKGGNFMVARLFELGGGNTNCIKKVV